MSTRPLSAALHTVTVVVRVAAFIRDSSRGASNSPKQLTAEALQVLGYTNEASEVRRTAVDKLPDLLARCVTAVGKDS